MKTVAGFDCGLYSVVVFVFHIKQQLFCLHSASVSSRVGGAAYHTVTWSKDRNGVGTDGIGYGPCRFVTTQLSCHLSIR